MLQAERLYSYYGKSPVLQDIDLVVEPGSFFSVLGRNGVGKTTLLRTLMGLTDRIEGTLRYDGRDIGPLATSERARLGLAYVPQGREVIPRFTVRENIVMGTFARQDKSREMPPYVFELFPVLREYLDRRGGDLSGGQQQQLAIARALAMNPKVLILDEPTEGIQPNIVRQIEDAIVRLNRDFGITIVLVEQNVPFARRVSDRFVIIDKGRVAYAGNGSDLTDAIADRYLTF